MRLGETGVWWCQGKGAAPGGRLSVAGVVKGNDGALGGYDE